MANSNGNGNGNGKQSYTAYNLQIILALTLGSLTFGYCYSVISNTLGQPGFIDYFGLGASTDYSNAITGAINGVFAAGGTFGALLAGWMCEAHGRKSTMRLASVVSVVGSAIQTGSVNIAMFLVARGITGFGIGMMVVLVPIYQAELSPPSARGWLVGQHGAWIVLGYAIAGWVGVGTYFSSNLSFQWRFPISLSCLPPLGLLLCSPWMPESPRWLLTRGEIDEAWQIVHRLHGDPADGDEGDTFARREFFQMTHQVEADSAAWAQTGTRSLFTKPSYRKRMMMGFFIQYATQTTGAQVIYLYMVQLYQNLGETGSIPLVLGAAYVTVATMSNFLGAFLLDRVGRKPLLTAGLAGCMVCLSLVSAMVARFAGTDNRAGNAMGVLFTFCFISFYGGGIDVVSYVYCSEIFPTHIRSQGMAWSMVGTFLSTLTYVEAAPTALANIGWRYYLVFICLTLLDIVILLSWCPETKGLSLEEINERFGDEVVVHLADVNAKSSAIYMPEIVEQEQRELA